MNQKELAKKIVDYLNELYKLDADAIRKFVDTRIPVNTAIANHPTVQVRAGDTINIVGLLNGLVGVKADGWGYIASLHDVDEITGTDVLQGFVVRT